MLEISTALGCTLVEMDERLSAEEYALRVAYLRLQHMNAEELASLDDAELDPDIRQEREARKLELML